MEHHLIDDQTGPRNERELTLSTGSILAIFLGLAVLCGAFFGFGYNVGRKSAPTPLNLSEVASEPSLPSSGAPKPAAGTPLIDPAVTTTVVPTPKPIRHLPPPEPAPATGEDAVSTETKPASARPPSPVPAAGAAPIVRLPTPVAPSALNPSAAPAAAGGTFVVQVAAVSHQDDADLLVGALRGRGYAVSTRSTPSDSFIHVQIGPFHDKREADAMRQRLLADGYNAIVKQ